MRKLLNKPWVVAVLAVIAVVVVAQSVLERPPSRGRVRSGEEPAGADNGFSEDGAGAPEARAGSLAEALTRITLPEALPDPFAPRRPRVVETAVGAREAVPDQADTVRLSAIWEQDGAAFVVLNGRICRAGDTLGRFTVAAIERDGVWLSHWKGRDFVRLGQEFTLLTPAAAAAQPSSATHEG